MRNSAKVSRKVAKPPKKRRRHDDEDQPSEEPQQVQVILKIEPASEEELSRVRKPPKPKTAVKLSCEKRARQYPEGTLHVDPDSGQLFCTACSIPIDHTRKNSIERHLETAFHLQNGGKSPAEIFEELARQADEDKASSSSSREAWCIAMKTALNISCEDRVKQYPDGTLHVDEESGLLCCSSCQIPVDHSRKGTIDKHLKSQTHAESSRRAPESETDPLVDTSKRTILRVNSFQKPHTKKRKNGDKNVDSGDEQKAPSKLAKQESNQIAKAAINVTPADRVDQYPAGTLHAEANQLFCSCCNISLDHTRKGSIDKHLKTRLHTEKSKRLEEQRDKKLSAISAAFAKTTEARDARNLALYQLVEAFTAADIPLKKLDHPKMRQYLMQNVSNLGALPHFSTLRTGYLPKVLENLRLEKQQRLAALDEVIDTVTIDSLSYLIENS